MNESTDGTLDSIALLEASLKELDELLAKLAALESQSQIVQEVASGDSCTKFVLSSDTDCNDAISNTAMIRSN